MSVLCHAMEFPHAAEAAADAGFPAPAAGGEDATAALVERARRGDETAFAGVVGLFEKRAYHFVLRMVGNPHDAEDVTQDTFVKVWHSLPRYQARHAFAAWLFTIARRTALNHLRARRRPAEELKDHDMAEEETPAETAADRDDASAVWTTAKRLKPDQYEALWLCYGEGFAVGEVARIMNSNSIRVRVLLHRARKRMAEWLTQQHPETRRAPRS